MTVTEMTARPALVVVPPGQMAYTDFRRAIETMWKVEVNGPDPRYMVNEDLKHGHPQTGTPNWVFNDPKLEEKVYDYLRKFTLDEARSLAAEVAWDLRMDRIEEHLFTGWLISLHDIVEEASA